jgi:hypothetical protein
MNKLVFIFFFIICIGNKLQAQVDTTKQRSEAEKYAWRLRQEVLYGTYIPKDVNEVILELNKKIDPQSKAKFANVTEDEAASKLFFSLGRWMTHNWSLYEGSRLSKYMKDMGIHHPDDMVRFFIVIYHRSLTKKPLEVKALVAKFAEKEAEEKKKRLEGGTILLQGLGFSIFILLRRLRWRPALFTCPQTLVDERLVRSNSTLSNPTITA